MPSLLRAAPNATADVRDALRKMKIHASRLYEYFISLSLSSIRHGTARISTDGYELAKPAAWALDAVPPLAAAMRLVGRVTTYHAAALGEPHAMSRDDVDFASI